MEKKLFFLVFIMLSTTIFGQDIIINFEGTGASSNTETIEVVNLSNCTSIEVPGNGTLNLITGTVEIDEIRYFESSLFQTYPNPFSGFASIEFSVSKSGNIKISVCNISGQIVAEYSSKMPAGIHTYGFIPNNSGIFFITVSGADFLHTSKIMCVGAGLQKAQLVYQEQVSDIFVEKSHKNANSKDFSFAEGDTLKLKGISGNYATIITDAPTSSITYIFEFVECTDYNGNNYAVVKIGNQTWMAENLKTTHYTNGIEIPLVDDDDEWADLDDNDTDKAYCYYNNNTNGEANIYGALYTWAAASNGKNSETNPSGVQGACPVGWHLPSDVEWDELLTELDGTDVAGGKLKSTCTIFWEGPNTGATNESGFSALPGGNRSYGDGSFYGLGCNGNWWSATEEAETDAWYRYLRNVNAVADRSFHTKSLGLSVRCIRD